MICTGGERIKYTATLQRLQPLENKFHFQILRLAIRSESKPVSFFHDRLQHLLVDSDREEGGREILSHRRSPVCPHGVEKLRGRLGYRKKGRNGLSGAYV
jgi:hypothetical protein